MSYVVKGRRIAIRGSVTIANNSFIFTLPVQKSTSAGVYDSNGTLLRTLWSKKVYPAGAHIEYWDGYIDAPGTADAKVLAPNGNYKVKVLSGNVTYTWKVPIGNTSDVAPWLNRWKGLDPPCGITIYNDKALVVTDYNEGRSAINYFNLSTPQTKNSVLNSSTTGIEARACCNDGINYYIAGGNPTTKADTETGANSYVSFIIGVDVDDFSEVTFSGGEAYAASGFRGYASIGNKITASRSMPYGMACQQGAGGFIFVCRPFVNTLTVIDKTFTVRQTLTYTDARFCAVDSAGDLWLVYNTNVIEKFTVNASTGALTSTGVTITGTTKPCGIGINPAGEIVIADGGNQQLRKAYPSTGGAVPNWTHGVLGGYANGPSVSGDKLYLDDPADNLNKVLPIAAMAFDSAGNCWQIDQGNNRILKYNSSRVYQTKIQYFPRLYSVSSDLNNPGRVFGDYQEFSLDPLTGVYEHVNNWGFYVPETLDGAKFRLVTCVTVEGHTYALQREASTTKFHVVELVDGVGMRLTTASTAGSEPDKYSRLDKNANLVRLSRADSVGEILKISIKYRTGIDGSGNPTYAASYVDLPGQWTLAAGDPTYGGNEEKLSIQYFTDSEGNPEVGVIYDTAVNTSQRYHLGYWDLTTGQVFARLQPKTFDGYIGDWTLDYFDTEQGVQNAGSRYMVVDDTLYIGDHGEFWKANLNGGQKNDWKHYHRCGLLIGRFGTSPFHLSDLNQPNEMAGNSFSASANKITDDKHVLYHGDENYFGAVHWWMVENLSSISIQEINVRLTSSPVVPSLGYIDLMEGLPHFGVTLPTSGPSRWSRPNADRNNGDAVDKWNATAGDFTESIYQRPNVSCHFRSDAIRSENVDCDLSIIRGAGNSDLANWRLVSRINYNRSDYNRNIAGEFIQILDNTGKVIADFCLHKHGNNDPVSIRANGSNEIYSGSDVDSVMRLDQDLIFERSGTQITVTYAGYTPVTVNMKDPTAAIGNPTTLRKYFWIAAANSSLDLARKSSIRDCDFYYL